MKKSEIIRPDWAQLFESILTEPGKLGDYYHAFHRYSLGNQALAISQMCERGLQISPIASFNAWKEKGRSVSKGQKAIGLWMPVTIKAKKESDKGSSQDGNAGADVSTERRIFVMRNNWFAFSQTKEDDQAEVPAKAPEPVPVIQWDKAQALMNLEIAERAFEHVDGNCQGMAWTKAKVIAINPMAALPYKTIFHELAHCLLHGEAEGDDELACATELTKCLKEAEAESTAFLCCAALGLPGLLEARGYVQDWLSDVPSREAFKKSAGRVFRAADRILKAGAISQETAEAEPAVQAPQPEKAEAQEQQLLLIA